MNDLNQTIESVSILSSVTNPEWVAIGISIVSAFYAWRSWIESKKANKISIHPKQIEIFNAFNELKMHADQEGMSLKMKEVVKFSKISQTVEIYFNKVFAKQLKRYYDVCWKLADLNSRLLRDREKNKEKEVKQIEEEQKILFDKEIKLSNEIKAKFKNVLKL